MLFAKCLKWAKSTPQRSPPLTSALPQDAEVGRLLMDRGARHYQFRAGSKLTPSLGRISASAPKADVNRSALDRLQWATYCLSYWPPIGSHAARHQIVVSWQCSLARGSRVRGRNHVERVDCSIVGAGEPQSGGRVRKIVRANLWQGPVAVISSFVGARRAPREDLGGSV
jgi:hypothetical protein